MQTYLDWRSDAMRLASVFRKGDWMYRRYFCPCGNICNRYDKSGVCSFCRQPISDDREVRPSWLVERRLEYANL